MSLRINGEAPDVIIVSAVAHADAKERFPDGWEAPVPLMQIVPQPE